MVISSKGARKAGGAGCKYKKISGKAKQVEVISSN